MGATKTLGAIIYKQGQEGQGLAEMVGVARSGSKLFVVDGTAKLMEALPPWVERLLPRRALRARGPEPLPGARLVHQQVNLHPYPKELMLRNHV